MPRPRRDPSIDLTSIGQDEQPRRRCSWPGCLRAGDFKAPRSRHELRNFRHFCLEHVRAYNQAWNYFEGMSQADIEAYLREDVTWHRPTWPMGEGHGRRDDGWRWQDPFGVFTNGGGDGGGHGASEWDTVAALPPRTAKMLRVMELSPDVTKAEIKARYKQLVKTHHPDLHGGDKAAEERLKLINEAYTYLLHDARFA
jgi:hypothetical protein